jgi:nitroreductase
VPESYTHYAVMDIGAFMNAFCLAATDQGLATCLQGALARYPDVVREHLPIPADEKIVVGIALGYPDNEAKINTFRSSREPLEKVLSFTGF